MDNCRYTKIGEIYGEHQITEDEKGHIIVTYENGEDCLTNSAKKQKTVIQFSCPDNGGIVRPLTAKIKLITGGQSNLVLSNLANYF